MQASFEGQLHRVETPDLLTFVNLGRRITTTGVRKGWRCPCIGSAFGPTTEQIVRLA